MKKFLVVGIVVLFLGVSVIPSTGNISKLSNVCKSNNPPYPPCDPIPSDGATNQSFCVNLCWTGGDPDGDEVTYDVYFGNYSPPPIVGSNYSGNCTDFPPYPFLEPFTTYYWKIVAWDEHGLKTSGPIWHFKTEENFPPYEPSDPFPEDEAKYVPLDVTLCWVGGDPNACDNVTYDVYFDDAFPLQMRKRNQSENYWKSPYNLTLFKTYYWQIVSWDNHGASTIGPVWYFSTDPPYPPNKPIISGPTRGKSGIEYNYTFTSIDPFSDYVYYWIDWGDESPAVEWDGPYPSGEPAVFSHTFVSQGDYTISAKAKNDYEIESPWSYLDVSMPKNKMNLLQYPFLLRLLERFPILEKLLSIIINNGL